MRNFRKKNIAPTNITREDNRELMTTNDKEVRSFSHFNPDDALGYNDTVNSKN